MIGGLGPESTIDYYGCIIPRFRARNPDSGYPHLIVNSFDVALPAEPARVRTHPEITSLQTGPPWIVH
jgi:aspartate/glutamate racemase